MAEFKTKLVLKAVDKVSSPLKSIKGNFGSLDKAVMKTSNRFALLKQKAEASNKGLRKLGKGMMSVGKAATLGITAPVVAGVAAGIKSFADFDNEIRGVKTLLDDDSFKSSGKTLGDGFNKMKKDIRVLSRESTSSMSQLTKSLFDTVSAGVDASKAVEVVGASSRLATAGLTDVSIATNGMTTAMNVWGTQAGTATEISEKFFIAQKFGKTTIEELSTDLGKVAPLAKAAGISFGQTLSAVSAVTTQGVKTNQAFTSMKAVLANVIKPTAEASEAAKLLGIQFDSEALRKKGFTVFMKEIIDRSKAIGVKPAQAFEKLFGSVEALNFAMAIGSNEGFKKYGDTLTAVTDKTGRATTFSKAYEEQSKSLTNKTIMMKNNFMDLARSVCETLAPMLTWLADTMANVFEWFRQHPKIATFAAVVVGLTAALVPLLIPLGWLFASWPLIAAGLGAITLGFGAFAAGVWAVMAPILLVVGIVTAAGSAIALLADGIAHLMGFDLGVFSTFADIGGGIADFFTGGDDTNAKDKKINTFGGAKNIDTAGSQITKKNQVEVKFSNLPAGTKIKTDRNLGNDININSGLQGAMVTQ